VLSVFLVLGAVVVAGLRDRAFVLRDLFLLPLAAC
jgi:hypothetical protein